MLKCAVMGGAVLVLLTFWVIGACRRLVRLRADACQAFAALDQLLVLQLTWLQTDVSESSAGEPLPSASASPLQAARGRVDAASRQAGVALAPVRANPVHAGAMAGLLQARAALHATLVRAARTKADSDLALARKRLLHEWIKLEHQELPLADAFNQAVDVYNRATRQFPASLVAALFGFRAGRSFVTFADRQPSR